MFDIKGLEPLEIVLELAEIVMFIVGFKEVRDAKNDTDKRAAVIQHLPKLFGFGRTDEGIWGSLRTALSKEYRVALDKIMQKLPLEEAVAFILTVGMMPNDITVNNKGDEEGVVEFSEDDRRVVFLKDLISDANMCATGGDIDSAIAVLRANRLTDESNLSKLQTMTKKYVFDFLGITSWDNLSSDHITRKLDEATNAVEAFRRKRRTSLFDFSGTRDFLSDLMKKFKLKGV